MKTIEQHYIEYRKACYGTLILSFAQERETRQAFHAGVLVAISTMSEISELPEDEAVERLKKMAEEATAAAAPKP